MAPPSLHCILPLCAWALQAASTVGGTMVPSTRHREGGQKMGVITVTASLTVTEPLTQPSGATKNIQDCLLQTGTPAVLLGNKAHIHVWTNNSRLVLHMKMLGRRTPGRSQLQCEGIKQTRDEKK